MAQSNLKQPMNHSLNVGSSHLRSSSQTTFFSNNSLPPLSPNSNLKEEMDVSSPGFPITPSYQENATLPPHMMHRRSNSDVPLGFSAMIHSSPQLAPISNQGMFGMVGNMKEIFRNEKPIGEQKSEGEVVDNLFNSFINLEHVDKDKDSLISGVTESESESRRVKRSATGDIAPPARHYRSLSMDSAIGKFHFGDDSPKPGNSLDQFSPSNHMNDNSAKINLDYGHSEFNEFELKKIMGDEKLAEVAISDPKRAKRILANRQSAARSKERKMRYISELEHKVQTLQTETTTLSTQVTITQKDYAELANQNNALKFRLQALEQQAILRDALNDALTAEVQRLKLENLAFREDGRTSSNGNAQQGTMKHQMFQMPSQQPTQMELFHSVTSTSSTASAAPTSA